MTQNYNDDGSLAFLKIESEKGTRQFSCSETTQQKLINLSFWVMDFIDGIKTRHGEDRFLVKIKMDKDADESTAQKFFTNSTQIKYIIGKINEMNAFPRKVTMRASGTRYYFE